MINSIFTKQLYLFICWDETTKPSESVHVNDAAAVAIAKISRIKKAQLQELKSKIIRFVKKHIRRYL